MNDDWMEFYDPMYVNTDTPWKHKRIWVWRPEWTNGPQACNAHDLRPSLNVIGLKWKPYKDIESGEPAP